MESAALKEQLQTLRSAIEPYFNEMQRVLVGQRVLIDRLLMGLMTGGHLLVEGVPGLAKTLAVRTMAATLHLQFSRIQFTPDLLPADLIGTQIFNPRSSEFSVKKGPIFANIVLADEVNRAPAKVQSALLEAMQEKQVTIGEETFPLPEPFLVLATQNPIEQEGTFPLPEAQIDRFMLRIALGYPSEDEERAILTRFERADPLDELAPVVEPAELIAMQEAVRNIRTEKSVMNYLLALCRNTRAAAGALLGVSPRGTLALHRASQARAAIHGRDFVLPDDVKQLAPFVLTHRIVVDGQSRLRGRKPEHVLQDVLEKTPAPVDTL